VFEFAGAGSVETFVLLVVNTATGSVVVVVLGKFCSPLAAFAVAAAVAEL
jgi:ABC-type maltose transport system permease subunit